MRLRDQQVWGLLGALQETREVEIDCDEFLSLMAQYAEVRAEARVLPAELEGADAHARLCPSCREELAALLDVLGTTAAV